jgi:hypothetical protein
VGTIAFIGACTQRVTRDDVTAARHQLDQEKQELRDAQENAFDRVRTEAREADDARHEALKPPGALDPIIKPDPAREERDVIDAQRNESDKIRKEARDVEDAARALAEKEAKLAADERRKELDRNGRQMIADADLAISELKTRQNNAPDDTALKTKIADLQVRRDNLQTALNSLSSATDANRTAAEAEAMKAMGELNRELAAGR